MALPAFRSASAKAAGTGAQTPALPASMVAGDIVILCATTIAGGSLSITANGSISSWTEITSGGLDVASGEKLYVWWGRWTSGTTGPTCTPGSDHCCAGTVAYSGCVPNGSPIGTSATSTEVTSDTSFSFATGISSSENDCMIICVASNGNDSNTATVGNMANTSLASLNNRQDFCTTSGGGGGYSLQEGTKATAGTMGTFTSTYSAVTPKAYIAFNLRPVVAISITTGIGTVVITGVAPTVTATNNLNITTALGTVTIVGLVPTITASDNKNITTALGTVTVSGLAPTANIGINISTALGLITIAGLAPTVSVSDNKNISIALGTVSIAGLVPTVSVSDNKNITAGLGAITISGLAPTVQTPRNIQTDLGAIVISGLAPTVSVTDHKNITIGLGQVIISGLEPSVGNSLNVTPAVGLISIVGFAPTINVTVSVETQAGSIVVSGLAPTVQALTNIFTEKGDVIINGFAPVINIGGGEALIETETGLVFITGYFPTVIGGRNEFFPIGSGVDDGGSSSPISDGNLNSTIGRIRKKSKMEYDI